MVTVKQGFQAPAVVIKYRSNVLVSTVNGVYFCYLEKSSIFESNLLDLWVCLLNGYRLHPMSQQTKAPGFDSRWLPSKMTKPSRWCIKIVRVLSPDKWVGFTERHERHPSYINWSNEFHVRLVN